MLFLEYIIFLMSILVYELSLFSAIGLLIGGIDEILVDIIWIFHHLWRKIFIYRYVEPSTTLSFKHTPNPGYLAVFVPAWDEAAVIGAMLSYATTHFRDANYKIFVGCYNNDVETIAAVRAVNNVQIKIVICGHDGPTTKADCLNILWSALKSEEAHGSIRYKAVILHDAEDMVSTDELVIFDRLIEKNALVQLPVIPIIDPHSRWISGHYCDEFAEAHAKTLVVREAIGAAVPAAGVGCAIRCDILNRLALERGGAPFDVGSLTEDYELGLRIHTFGERTIFVRLPRKGEFGIVGTRAHFPATLDAAVRQKTRWVIGIALAGWDRLGWGRGLVEPWMRLRDRRPIIAAFILSSAYIALILTAFLMLIDVLGGPKFQPITGEVAILIKINLLLLIWRMAVKAYFVGQLYGWGEAVYSIPRTVVANVIAIMAARRAVCQYWFILRGRQLKWDKTDHKFPVDHKS